MQTFNPPRKAKRPVPLELLASASDEDHLDVVEDEFDNEEGEDDGSLVLRSFFF